MHSADTVTKSVHVRWLWKTQGTERVQWNQEKRKVHQGLCVPSNKTCQSEWHRGSLHNSIKECTAIGVCPNAQHTHRASPYSTCTVLFCTPCECCPEHIQCSVLNTLTEVLNTFSTQPWTPSMNYAKQHQCVVLNPFTALLDNFHGLP